MEQKTDLRIQKTQKALINAMMDMMSAKTFDEITVRDLCDAASIRRATFYSHFKDKYDLLQYIMENYRAQWLDYPLNTEDPYLELIKIGLDFFDNNKQLIQNMQRSNVVEILFSMLFEQVHLQIVRIIKNSSQTLEPKDKELVSSMLASSIISAMFWWMEHQNTISKSEMYEKLCNITQFMSGWQI